MSENRYSPKKGGHDGNAAQKYEHLSGLTPDELIDELADQWDAMDDQEYDPQLMDAYLAALDEKDPAVSDYSAEDSLAAFREEHSHLLQQVEPASKTSDRIKNPRPLRRWRAFRLVAATVVIMLSCMIAAQAFGLDVFGAIARWTEETFHFGTSAQSDQTDESQAEEDYEYGSLQEALETNGISELAAPNWYPTGFELNEIGVFPTPPTIKLQATYQNGEKFIFVTIRQFASPEDANSGTFEKDNATVILFECNGITHYIMSNIDQATATWINQNLMCSISGDLSEDDLKDMIKSVYER
ncbi:MAG: DUF4367 domain-containing protein [Syntrophomonadaceae bacterium]|nr:DUF4367 domain-containing protein [Syntrophomonadaceae bacterium]